MFIFYPKSSEWMKDSRSKDLDFLNPSFIIVRYCLTLLSTNWNFISTFPSLKKKHFSSLFVDSRGELYFQPTWQLPIGWCDRVFIFAMAGYFRYANEVPRFRGRSKVNRSQRPETVWRDWKEKRKAASDWWPTVEEANQEPCFFYFPVQEQMIPSSESSAILQSAGGGCALRTRGRLLLAPFHQRVVSFFTASRRWEHALGRVLSPHLRWTRRRCDATERHGRSISVADEICMTRWRSVRKVRNPKRPPPPSFATLHGSIILFHSSSNSK